MSGQPIRLVTSDPSLAPLCETLERHLASVSELNDLVFPVTLVASLDDLKEAQDAEALRETPMLSLSPGEGRRRLGAPRTRAGVSNEH